MQIKKVKIIKEKSINKFKKINPQLSLHFKIKLRIYFFRICFELTF